LKILYLSIIVISVVLIVYGTETVFATENQCCGPPIVITSDSPLKQFMSGIAAKDVACKEGVLVLKSEDGSPACVKPEHIGKLLKRGWMSRDNLPPTFSCNEYCSTSLLYDYGYFCRGLGVQNNCFLQQAFGNSNLAVIERNQSLENESGIATIENQTYYFDTLNDTLSSYHGVAAIPITFHNVVFTLFPSVFSAGPPGSCGDTGFSADLKFSDNTHELLSVHIPGMPCLQNYTETELSNHTNQQAGLEVYHGKIRLLVSTNNQT